ncbi:MAG: S8 family serine peptidase [Planctomycetes bacterium]|nr:S8 family serine peptidase [Planctomycetota bacterium]MCB9935758.1 S8 family serine peptidase [Planctomycetota bacterium]
MKTLFNIRSLMACLALAATFAPVAGAQVRPTLYGQPELNRDNGVKIKSGIEPILTRLGQLAEAGYDWREYATTAGLEMDDSGLIVEITVDAPAKVFNPDLALLDVIQVVHHDHADPSQTTPLETARVRINPETLAELQLELSVRQHIVKIEAYRRPVANSFGDIIGEGLEAMLADGYHRAGLTGKGVRVAVIDIGFGGIDANAVETGDVDRIVTQLNLDQDSETHGTSMIEVLRDIAPHAELKAYRLDAGLDVLSAVHDAINSKIDLIVCPLSWFDLPGRGLAAEAARLAVSHGIRWVNAAGNFGDGRYFESEGAAAVEIGTEAFITFDEEMSDPYQFINELADGERFEIHLAVDRNADQTALSLELYSWDGMSNQFVLEAQGDPDAAHQVISHVYADGMYMFPMIRLIGQGGTPAHRMFATAGRLHFAQAAGSLTNPAGVPGVISVGAVDAGDYPDGIAPLDYSSQGGGLFKLELSLCGPTNCTTGMNGPQGFSGTSAAAANVAGLLALQLADQGLSVDPLGLLKYLPVGDTETAGAGVVMALMDEYEPDNTADTATDMGKGGYLLDGRSLSPGTDEDWFSFTLEAPMNVEFVIEGVVGSFEVLDQNLTIVHQGAAVSGESRALPAGTFFIRVCADGTVSPEYSLMVNQFLGGPEAPQALTPAGNVLITEQAVTLAWAPAIGPGVIIHQLQVAKDAGFKKLVASATVEGASFDFTSDEADPDSGEITYYWRVLAENEYGSSNWSEVAVFRQNLGDVHLASDVITDAEPNGGVTVVTLLAPESPEAQAQPEAAGCTTGSSGSGLTLALLAAIVAAALVRARRREAR